MTDVSVQTEPISQELVELKVRETIAQALDIEVDDVQLSASLKANLGAESLDMLDIAFMLEREFKIEFPRMDVLQRASTHFGEDAMIQDGVITDFGMGLLRSTMPELQKEQLQPGMRAAEMAGLITVRTFVRIVIRLLEAKQRFSRQCPACSEMSLEESQATPEFVCAKCGHVVPLPSGDEILFQDMLRNFET
jgi:acyl carrier protein